MSMIAAEYPPTLRVKPPVGSRTAEPEAATCVARLAVPAKSCPRTVEILTALRDVFDGFEGAAEAESGPPPVAESA